MRRLLWTLGFLAWPSLAAAQAVTGIVVEAGTGTPVEGAMVVLLRNGAAVQRVLTDAQGSFSLTARRGGRHTIRVDRIGYASTETPPFSLPGDATFHRIVAQVQPLELRGLDVESARRCEVRPEEGRITARVWGEARKALEATAWTQEREVYRYTLLRFTRVLADDGRTVLSEKREFQRGYARTPFTSLPAERLIREGFVQEEPGDGAVYYAPDAEAFLSDAFLDTHCMGVRRGEGENWGLVGLEFEPVPGRSLPEVEGVLWLDGATARLRRLDYRYRNLPARDAREAGGSVTFGGLPDGTWIVREWRIRMPRSGREVGSARLVLLGYLEEGGVVWRVTDRSGRVVVEANTGSVTGTVRDSLGASPVSGAVVWARGAPFVDTTDADGGFVLSGLSAGVFSVGAVTPDLAAWGVGPRHERVEASPGRVASLALKLPSVREAAQRWCGPVARSGLSTVVLGRVSRPSGEPVPGARVRAVWDAAAMAFDPGRPVTPDAPGSAWSPSRSGAGPGIETRTDGLGIFLLCAVPAGQVLALEASEGLRTPRRVRLVIRPGPSVRTVIFQLPATRR